MGNGPQYTLAQLNADGEIEAIGPDNPLYIEGGGGGGSGFPVESPDGQTEATFGDAGLSVLSDSGFDTIIGKDGFRVTSPSGAINPINVQVFDGATYVEISSDGAAGFIIFSGAVNTVVPINQMAGTATLATHLITKGYVDAKVPAPPVSGTFRLTSTNGVISWVAV